MSKPILATIPSAYKSGTLYSVLPTNADGDFTFSRASNATRVNKDGLIETVASNTPRLDYSDGSCPSLLLEPQRSNLITYSEDFTNSAWTKTSVDITNSDEVSPSGYLNAKKMTGTATSTKRIFVVLSTTASLNYTYSLYVKKGNTSLLTFITSSGSLSCTFNLDTLTASNGSIEDAGNGWYRLSAKATASSTTEVWQILLNSADSAGTFHHIYGAQVEQGSYPTSYIPTLGSQETRLADNCYGAGDSNLFNTTVGTMYVDITPYLSNNSPYYISMSDGSGNNRFSLFFYNSQQIRFYVIGNGGSSVNAYYTIPFNQRMKVAVTFRENEFYFFVNGNLITKDTLGNIPIGLDRLNFSAYYNGAFFEGKVHDARVYNEVLSTTELATLTTL